MQNHVNLTLKLTQIDKVKEHKIRQFSVRKTCDT